MGRYTEQQALPAQVIYAGFFSFGSQIGRSQGAAGGDAGAFQNTPEYSRAHLYDCGRAACVIFPLHGLIFSTKLNTDGLAFAAIVLLSGPLA